jgi:hypothetical protein
LEIGPYTWEVYTAASISVDGEECLGLTDSERLAIYIDSSLKGPQLNNTWYHELTHAGFFSYGLHDLPEELEELVAEKIGLIIAQVLKQM